MAHGIVTVGNELRTKVGKGLEHAGTDHRCLCYLNGHVRVLLQEAKGRRQHRHMMPDLLQSRTWHEHYRIGPLRIGLVS